MLSYKFRVNESTWTADLKVQYLKISPYKILRSNVCRSIGIGFSFMFSVSAAHSLDFRENFNGAMRIDRESVWISADGLIELGDTQKLKDFLSTVAVYDGHRIVFDSPGGSVLEAIELGRFIRDHRLRTAVAATVADGEYSTSAPGICASACVLAFVGGVERGASDGSKVGVHQMSSSSYTELMQAATNIEALNDVKVQFQLLNGMALYHLLKMGIDPEIMVLSSSVLPDSIYWLTREDVIRTKVAFEPKGFGPWLLEAYGEGLVVYSRSQDSNNQITIFCGSNRRMNFRLTFEDSEMAASFITANEGMTSIHVLGESIPSRLLKITRSDLQVAISGPWNLRQVDYRDVFFVEGVVGSVRDRFALYNFNSTRFEESVKLAESNCI